MKAPIPNYWGRFADARAFAEHVKTTPIGRVWRVELGETGESVTLKNFFTSIKDSGHSISVKGKAERDICAAVDLAAEKGWKSIIVDGSEESRLSVAIAAAKRTVNVEGIAKQVIAKAHRRGADAEAGLETVKMRRKVAIAALGLLLCTSPALAFKFPNGRLTGSIGSDGAPKPTASSVCVRGYARLVRDRYDAEWRRYQWKRRQSFLIYSSAAEIHCDRMSCRASSSSRSTMIRWLSRQEHLRMLQPISS